MAKKRDWRNAVLVAVDQALEQGVPSDDSTLQLLQRIGEGASYSDLRDGGWNEILGWCRRQQRDWVERTAHEIAEEVREGHLDPDEVGERVTEEADNAAIYTNHNLITLIGTQNEEAWFDQGLGEVGDDFTTVVAHLAFAANEQDLQEALADEDLEPEEDEEDEEEDDEEED